MVSAQESIKVAMVWQDMSYQTPGGTVELWSRGAATGLCEGWAEDADRCLGSEMSGFGGG